MATATRRELLHPRAWRRAVPHPDTTPPPAPVAERVVPDAELRALVASHGLQHRFDDLRRLARHSARLVPDHDGGTWAARIAHGSEASREGGRLVACALDLGQLDPGVATVDRRAAAVLLAFDDGPLQAGGHGLIDCGTASVRPLEPGEALTAPGGLRVSAATERSLPRVWSAAVSPLGLSEEEAERFIALRLALADRQGAALFDTAGSGCSFDRVLGYPDETTGLMPGRCGGDPGDWRLLLQLTLSGWRGLGWRTRPRRIYWWITDASLASRSFDAVRVFAH